MVARAVMKAWQASLERTPPASRVHQPRTAEGGPTAIGGWRRPPGDDNVESLPKEVGDDDPEIRIAKRDDIVPRRPGPGVVSEPMPSEGFWSSHQFWKGLVVGAGIVLLVKTVMAARAPYGVNWFGF